MAGSLECTMNGKSVSIEVKRDLRNTVIVPTLMQANNGPGMRVSYRVQAVEMSYLRSVCCVSRMDGLSNESVHECFGMCYVGKGKKRGLV